MKMSFVLGRHLDGTSEIPYTNRFLTEGGIEISLRPFEASVSTIARNTYKASRQLDCRNTVVVVAGQLFRD